MKLQVLLAIALAFVLALVPSSRMMNAAQEEQERLRALIWQTMVEYEFPSPFWTEDFWLTEEEHLYITDTTGMRVFSAYRQHTELWFFLDMLNMFFPMRAVFLVYENSVASLPLTHSRYSMQPIDHGGNPAVEYIVLGTTQTVRTIYQVVEGQVAVVFSEITYVNFYQ